MIINQRFDVVCPDCGAVKNVNYSNFRKSLKKPTLCRNCLAKKIGFKKGHPFGIRFGSGQKEYRGEYTPERIEKIKKNRIGKGVGERHWLWKGGVTSTNKKIRQSHEYKEWRNSVFKRDDYTCVNCGKRGGVINADHIKPFSLFPELGFDLNNGRTLCKDCHTRIGWSLFKDGNPRKKI